MPSTWIDSGDKTDENTCLCGAPILMNEYRQKKKNNV